MNFSFTVDVEVERTQGKFASRDDLEAKLQEELEGADPGNVEGDEGGEYEVSSWEVSVVERTKKVRASSKPAPDEKVTFGHLGRLVYDWVKLSAYPENEELQENFSTTMAEILSSQPNVTAQARKMLETWAPAGKKE